MWSLAYLKGHLAPAFEEGLRDWSRKVVERTARLGLTEDLKMGLQDI